MSESDVKKLVEEIRTMSDLEKSLLISHCFKMIADLRAQLEIATKALKKFSKNAFASAKEALEKMEKVK